MFDSLFQDLRYAARSLARRPLVTAVTALSLALGIGVNAALFSVFDHLLLRQLPSARALQRAEGFQEESLLQVGLHEFGDCLHVLLVRPMRRMTDNMVAFRADPENPAAFRAVASVTWLNLMFARGALSSDEFLSSLPENNTAVKPPPADVVDRQPRADPDVAERPGDCHAAARQGRA